RGEQMVGAQLVVRARAAGADGRIQGPRRHLVHFVQEGAEIDVEAHAAFSSGCFARGAGPPGKQTQASSRFSVHSQVSIPSLGAPGSIARRNGGFSAARMPRIMSYSRGSSRKRATRANTESRPSPPGASDAYVPRSSGPIRSRNLPARSGMRSPALKSSPRVQQATPRRARWSGGTATDRWAYGPISTREPPRKSDTIFASPSALLDRRARRGA